MLCLSGFELYFRWVPLMGWKKRRDLSRGNLAQHFFIFSIKKNLKRELMSGQNFLVSENAV